jgi:hypothetical protein
MQTRSQVAQYIHELRSVRTPNLTPREKNRAIRGYARQFVRSTGEKSKTNGTYRAERELASLGGELSGTRSGRFSHPEPNFREIRHEPEPSAGSHNFLKRGTKVRMLTDHISLKKGEIGEVTDVVAWVGRTGCLVELTFRDGIPRFTQDAKNLLNLVEVVK